jgi:hypothetical protein
MASSLQIKTGALTSTVTSDNDARAQTVLLNFATAIGSPDTDPPQQRLDAVAAYLIQYMQNAAQSRAFQEQSATLRAQVEADIRF